MILLLGPCSHHLALIHHYNFVRDSLNRGDVMGDEHVGDIELLLQPQQKLRIPSWTIWSSAEVTSSQMMTSGSAANALAMQIRCF